MPDLQTCRILMIDGQEPLVKMFSRMALKVLDPGHRIVVVTAETDLDILRYARTYRFDLYILILNNIMFPLKSDGNENRISHAIALVKQLKETYGTPLISLSGLSEDPTIEPRALEAGADFFYPLPFTYRSLIPAIASSLSR